MVEMWEIGGTYEDNDHIKKGIYVSRGWDFGRVKIGAGIMKAWLENLGAGAGSEGEPGRGRRVPVTWQPDKE